MAVTDPEKARDIATWQLAPIQYGFEDPASLWWQRVGPYLFFGPDQYPVAQSIGLYQRFHEFDLVEAGLEEETREGCEILLAEVPSAVEIAVALGVTSGKMSSVGVYVSGEAARDRPDATRIQRLQEYRMRHQTCDATIAIEKRVNPEQTVMRGRGGDDGLRPAQVGVGALELVKKSRYRIRTDRHVSADLDVALAKGAGYDSRSLARVRIHDHEELLWQ